MKLSRRDALATLAAVSTASVAGCSSPAVPATDGSDPLDEGALEVLVAAAEVVYPSEATGVDEFVRTYAVGRVANDPAHREGMATAVADLDDLARDRKGEAFAALAPETRDRLLHAVGADIADPDPNGPLPARLRRFVVDDLLFAFYASPTGGELVGVENPVGYPGGIDSYQRPPPGKRDTAGSTEGSDGE